MGTSLKPLEAGLHAASLLACAALAAGLWSLKREPSPAVPETAPAPPPPAAEDAKVLSLEREVESLRLRLRDLEASRARPPSAAPAPDTSAASLLAALDDPKVQEKVREAAGLPAFATVPVMSHMIQDPADADPFHGMDLNPGQRIVLGTILQESTQQVTDLIEKLEKKEWTKEQARAELSRRREGADAQARSALTEAQFQDFRQRIAPMRQMTDAILDGKGAIQYRVLGSDGVILTSPDPGSGK